MTYLRIPAEVKNMLVSESGAGSMSDRSIDTRVKESIVHVSID